MLHWEATYTVVRPGTQNFRVTDYIDSVNPPTSAYINRHWQKMNTGYTVIDIEVEEVARVGTITTSYVD